MTEPTAYDLIGWDKFSPWAKRQIEEIAKREGIALHAFTDYETLARLVRLYRASW